MHCDFSFSAFSQLIKVRPQFRVCHLQSFSIIDHPYLPFLRLGKVNPSLLIGTNNKMRKLFKSVLNDNLSFYELIIKFSPFSMCVGNCETETEKQRMAVCGLPLHLGGSGRCKTLEQEFIFQIGTLNPHVINERFPFTFDRVNFWIGSCLSVRS